MAVRSQESISASADVSASISGNLSDDSILGSVTSISNWTRLTKPGLKVKLKQGSVLRFAIVPKASPDSVDYIVNVSTNILEIGAYTGTGKSDVIGFRKKDATSDDGSGISLKSGFKPHGITAVALIVKTADLSVSFNDVRKAATTLAVTSNKAELETAIGNLASGSAIKTAATAIKDQVEAAVSSAEGKKGSGLDPNLACYKLNPRIEGLDYAFGNGLRLKTDFKGQFCGNGTSVNFYLGSISLGSFTAKKNLGLHELIKQAKYSDKHIKTLRLLIENDKDDNVYNGLNISDATFTGANLDAVLNSFTAKNAKNKVSALAYATIRYFDRQVYTQISAGNHHTLGASGGRGFSFGESYETSKFVSTKTNDNEKYCLSNVSFYNKLGRTPDFFSLRKGYDDAFYKSASSTYRGLSVSGQTCLRNFQNEAIKYFYNPISASLNLDLNIKVSQVETDQDTNALITEQNDLYTFGYNHKGQLGLGDKRAVQKPTKVATLPSTDNKAVFVATGGAKMFVVTTKGKVYSAGYNNSGSLGQGRTSSQMQRNQTFSPVLMPDGEYVVHVAVRDNHIYALTAGNKVYGWGENGKYELGDDTTNDVHTPKEIVGLTNKDIIFIEAGADFGLAASHGGDVYVWGENDYGALAFGTAGFSSKTSTVQKVKSPNNELRSPTKSDFS